MFFIFRIKKLQTIIRTIISPGFSDQQMEGGEGAKKRHKLKSSGKKNLPIQVSGLPGLPGLPGSPEFNNGYHNIGYYDDNDESDKRGDNGDGLEAVKS